MRYSSGRTRRYGNLDEIKEINVMPLVDLLLQLFIAVVIFFPVVEYGMNINLPKGTTDTIKREQTRTLSVDKNGRVYLNDVTKTPQQLRADLLALAKISPPVTILVKADQGNNYGKVMEVLKELHAARITRIALMTQEESPPRLARR
ncbi:MAG TPA: biopolymer transporter ExbD [Verrucomicrobiae bacterium]|nr:biopolymer transporter ExbD [Verrucomicrobiae bacterium]